MLGVAPKGSPCNVWNGTSWLTTADTTSCNLVQQKKIKPVRLSNQFCTNHNKLYMYIAQYWTKGQSLQGLEHHESTFNRQEIIQRHNSTTNHRYYNYYYYKKKQVKPVRLLNKLTQHYTWSRVLILPSGSSLAHRIGMHRDTKLAVMAGPGMVGRLDAAVRPHSHMLATALNRLQGNMRGI